MTKDFCGRRFALVTDGEQCYDIAMISAERTCLKQRRSGEGRMVALSPDILCDFIATGLNLCCLQNELLIPARNTGRLNDAVLKSSVRKKEEEAA